MEIKGLTRLQLHQYWKRLFSKLRVCAPSRIGFQLRSVREVCYDLFGFFDAVYNNIYCLVIERLPFLTQANDHKLGFSNIEVSLVSSEPEINAFQFSIDLGLKINHVRRSKSNIRVISIHSRGAEAQAIW